jgi:hypothetical protein
MDPREVQVPDIKAMQNTVRLLLFAGILTLGATVVCIAALSDDLIQYYADRQRLVEARKMVDLLEKLNADYDALLEQIRQDPNLIRRLGTATLGTPPQDANTAHPEVRLEELLAARQALSVADDVPEEPPSLPDWLTRCSHPLHRLAMFLCGGGLVMVAFVYFRPQVGSAGRQAGLRPPSGASEARKLEEPETTGPSVAPDEEPRG